MYFCTFLELISLLWSLLHCFAFDSAVIYASQKKRYVLSEVKVQKPSLVLYSKKKLECVCWHSLPPLCIVCEEFKSSFFVKSPMSCLSMTLCFGRSMACFLSLAACQKLHVLLHGGEGKAHSCLVYIALKSVCREITVFLL